MNDPSIHELLAAFTIILNNGIDLGVILYIILAPKISYFTKLGGK